MILWSSGETLFPASQIFYKFNFGHSSCHTYFHVLHLSQKHIQLPIKLSYIDRAFVIECMHVHARDRRLTEEAFAKLFVKQNGDTVVQNMGSLTEQELRKIQKFIKLNYQEMYLKWSAYSQQGFYGEGK